MRLPADATLIVIDVQEAIDDPRSGRPDNPAAETNIAALIAAWRRETLPLVHVRHDSLERGSPYVPGASGHRFKACAMPLYGEATIGKTGASAFAGTALESLLDDIGATTLVLCGALTSHSIEATARHAGDLGYRTFVVADACWPTEHARKPLLVDVDGERASVVDTAAALGAAAMAKARQRRQAQRSPGG
jgi:nicotinamidase-related amidase